MPTSSAESSSVQLPAPPFVGRRGEKDALSVAFEDARTGRGVAVMVAGESGIGKTALAHSFAEEMAERWGAVVLAGRCYDRESVPYKALDGVIDALSTYVMRLPRIDAAALLPRHASLLSHVFPVLRRSEVLAEAPRAHRDTYDPVIMRARVFAAMRELMAYFQACLDERRRRPRDDIMTLLVEAEIPGEGTRLDDDELKAFFNLLATAGNETVTKLLATLFDLLAEHPDQRRECAENPALIPDAYHEGLRYDMPTQFLCRTVAKPIEFHGQTFQPDQGVCLLYPAANRDEREFPDPDRFDIHRKAPRILSFGQGIHLCLGMQVAKLEGRLCLEALLSRMPEYEVDLDAADWFRTDFVQGYAALPITFQPA